MAEFTVSSTCFYLFLFMDLLERCDLTSSISENQSYSTERQWTQHHVLTEAVWKSQQPLIP